MKCRTMKAASSNHFFGLLARIHVRYDDAKCAAIQNA